MRNKMTKSTFAERLSLIIKEKNIRQIDLCKATGIGKSAMSQYLHGAFEPKQHNLHTLASFLNVSEAWLMGYDVPKYRNSPGHMTSLSKNISGTSNNEKQPEDNFKTFSFIMKDNSMESAHIPKGATVIVKPLKSFESGQIVHFSYNNAPPLLRTIYIQENHILLAASSTEYSPIICEHDALTKGILKINGVVVKVIIEM